MNRKVAIQTEFIKLDQFLKYVGIDKQNGISIELRD